MMEKKKISLIIQFVTVASVWSSTYAEWVASAFQSLFGFDLFSGVAWKRFFSDFMNSYWIIDSVGDVVFILCVLLVIPLWAFGWFVVWKVVSKINVTAVLPKCFSEKKEKKQIVEMAESRKPFVPNKLRVQSGALLSVNLTTASNDMNASQTGENTPSVKKVMKQFDIQSIIPLVAHLPAEVLPDINMNSCYASFALASDDKALVVHAINQPGSVWVADVDGDIDECDWYNEGSVLKKPIADIRKIAKDLEEGEEGSVALPVILLMSGTLLNPEEAKAYLNANHVVLLRLDEAEANGVPLLTDFAEDFFGEKENNNQNGQVEEVPVKTEETSVSAEEMTGGES